MADLDEAIQLARQQAINSSEEGSVDRAHNWSKLGYRCYEKYCQTGVVDDFNEAVQASREAIDTALGDQALYLNTLWDRLLRRYLLTGASADLNEAVQFASTATFKGHSWEAIFLLGLGYSLDDRYSRTGEMTELEEAIKVGRRAINATSKGSKMWKRCLESLSTRLYQRSLRTGLLAHVDEAIEILNDAIDTIPQGHPDQVTYAIQLVIALRDRAARTGTTADLEEAIRMMKKVDLTMPEDHPDRPMCSMNLAGSLRNRYERTGAITDLNDSIRIMQDTVDSIPDWDLHWSGYRDNLGSGLYDRYTHTGAMADLEEAIRMGEEATNATRKGFPDRPNHLSNLAIRLRSRYARSGAIADIEEAIRVGREAVQASRDGDSGRASHLNNLGCALGDRYTKMGSLKDLEEAIQVTRAAVDQSAEDHPIRARYLNSLSIRLSNRYDRTGDITNLEEAIHATRLAIALTPKDHPEHAIHLGVLGVHLRIQYLRTRAIVDLEEAISCHRFVLHQPTTSTFTRIVAGRWVIRHCAIKADWQQACEAAKAVVPLIPRLTTRSLDNADKQHMLSQVVGLASDAAAAALNAGKGPSTALEFLEQGRGVLASSIEEMRTDILDLQREHPDLADEFDRLRNTLEPQTLPNGSLVRDRTQQRSWQTQAKLRHDISRELDELITKIQCLSGFADFLRAPSEAEIRAAAEFGPIVVINVSQYRCDAILVNQRQIRHLALPDLTEKDINMASQREGGRGTPKVLSWLWKTIASPVLDALGFTQPPSDDGWSRIWWIPTGPLSRFPLHAAGRHGDGSTDTVLDRIMSSYSSSIKAIVHGRSQGRGIVNPSASSQALLVAMENTPESPRLSFAPKEVEMLHEICKAMAVHPVEPGRRRQDIVAHLSTCKIFHFAGHGYTNTKDPLRSHLRLEDWKMNPLTVASLLEMNIRKHAPFLAYLSACGTAQVGDEKFVDESIHLISACQLAGFRHVVGALWEVVDESCVDVAKGTYEGMRDGDMTDQSVCTGLHKAMRELRHRQRTVPVKVACRNEQALKEDSRAPGKRMKFPDTVDGTLRDHNLPRDVVPYDSDDEDEQKVSLSWVPYVHYGV